MRGRGTAARPHQPEPWAADVQGIIRSARVPAPRNEFMRLRLADDGMVPELEAALIGAVGRPDDVFDFAIVALARDRRVAATGVGDEMLADFEACCRARADGRASLELAATVHVENVAAAAMFRRNGWVAGATLSGDDQFRFWAKLLTR
jgi:GNAT superfamily N-acetyltransferase